MNHTQLLERCREILRVPILHTQVISKGMEQTVLSVTTASQQFIAKASQQKETIFREVMACTLLNKKIPLPQIVFADEEMLIENFIEGEDLDTLSLSDEEQQRTYIDAGRILYSIHQQSAEGFGVIMTNGKGKHNNLKNFSFYNERNLARLRKKYLSGSEIKRFERYVEKNDHYFNNTQSVLLHYDFVDSNIRYNNQQISGIIDFGDLSGGCPALDFAWIYIYYYGNKKWDYILQGYNEPIDIEETRFFAACNLIYFILNDGDPKKVQHKLDMLNEIVQYKSFFGLF
ncbi:MAG: aminoglycoside phosphotransferase family protein [Bacteroidota bacterium]|nr:aminoglycoside phosphotransferase family protein [Bacteroidota bacterium]